MFSNKYIFIYASAMVLIVATVLALAAVLLQPAQSKNVRIEKMQSILASAGIVSEKSNVESMYQQVIVEELLVDVDGQPVQSTQKAFDINMKVELKKYTDLQAGKSTDKPVFPIFVCEYQGQRSLIIPLQGKGLWGPLWGYIALKDDFNHIQGATFDHKGETPGLGAEIATPKFQSQFIGKSIFDEQGAFVSVDVVKGGVLNAGVNPDHGVDAISGGTITSQGLSAMIKDVLNIYVPYFKKQIAAMQLPEVLPMGSDSLNVVQNN